MTGWLSAISMSVRGIIITGIISFSLFSCKPAEILLHGDITGVVTDAASSQPIEGASIKLNNTNDTTSTGSDGTFLLKSIIPDNYEIQSSKLGYGVSKKNVTVTSANTNQIDFSLDGIAVPGYSSRCLDFGLDSTTLSFTISNHGKGTFSYLITKSQNWITVSPSSGEISNETDNIRVTINKTGLSDNIYNEIIEVTTTGPGVLITDTLHINLNGVADRNCNYYKVVTIGTQTWTAENLRIGTIIPVQRVQSDNGYIEKWCNDCTTYGGLYTWYEAMQYNPTDTGAIGKAQGICPVGWHIPTEQEVITLSDYLGGYGVAGGKMKATGTSLWQAPNSEADNESGFTALPGGYTNRGDQLIDLSNPDPFSNKFGGKGNTAAFWVSKLYPQFVFSGSNLPPYDAGGVYYVISGNSELYFGGNQPANWGSSIRCIKDPPKK